MSGSFVSSIDAAPVLDGHPAGNKVRAGRGHEAHSPYEEPGRIPAVVVRKNDNRALGNLPASIAAPAKTRFSGLSRRLGGSPSLVFEKRIETIIAVLTHYDYLGILALFRQ